MEVQYQDTFFKSLKKLIRHNTWWYKTYKFFRYDIQRFFRNIWLFRKELAHYHKWDWRYQISMLRRGLELEADYLEKYGYEVDESRLKKVDKMRRAIEILKLHENDTFMEEAEKELGYEYECGDFEFELIPGSENYAMKDAKDEDVKKRNKAISDRARGIEENTFTEFLNILKGQDYTKFNKDIDWNKQFDGSGIKSWWD